LKYSVDGDKTRTTWAPKAFVYIIEINTPSYGHVTLKRDGDKDEQGYFAFSNDNYTYYTLVETPTEEN
jgi:hypothetical protein